MVDNAVWSHTVDFRAGDGGFILGGTSPQNQGGTYAPGVGWVVSVSSGTGGDPYFKCASIIKTLPSAVSVTQMGMTYDMTVGFVGPLLSGNDNAQLGDSANTANDVQILFSGAVNGTGLTLTNNKSFSTSQLWAYVCSDNGLASDGSPGNFTGTAMIRKVTITGIGLNPFLLDDGAECRCNYIGNDLDEARD